MCFAPYLGIGRAGGGGGGFQGVGTQPAYAVFHPGQLKNFVEHLPVCFWDSSSLKRGGALSCVTSCGKRQRRSRTTDAQIRFFQGKLDGPWNETNGAGVAQRSRDGNWTLCVSTSKVLQKANNSYMGHLEGEPCDYAIFLEAKFENDFLLHLHGTTANSLDKFVFEVFDKQSCTQTCAPGGLCFFFQATLKCHCKLW